MNRGHPPGGGSGGGPDDDSGDDSGDDLSDPSLPRRRRHGAVPNEAALEALGASSEPGSAPVANAP